MACVCALDMADTQVLIHSDSQAAILATHNPLIYSHTVLETVNSLNTLADTGKQVTLQWVRGHNNTAGNEYADSIVKTGATLLVAGPEPFLPLSKAVCRKAAHHLLIYLWNNKWQRVIDYRQTKILFPTPNNYQTKNLLRQTRKSLGLLIRHITGFSNLSYPQSLQQPGCSPIYRLCGEAREESNHIIRECRALTRTRLDTLFQIKITYEWFVLGLFHFLSSPTVARLENDNRTNMVLLPHPPPTPHPQAPHRPRTRGPTRYSSSRYSSQGSF
jgi:hypothetical protein